MYEIGVGMVTRLACGALGAGDLFIVHGPDGLPIVQIFRRVHGSSSFVFVVPSA
jgi:hypothetical protein